jgi:hypothetical protein
LSEEAVITLVRLPAYVPDPRIRKIPSIAGSKGASPPLSHADVKNGRADVSPIRKTARIHGIYGRTTILIRGTRAPQGIVDGDHRAG